MDKARFGAGCFWCIEDIFRSSHGVISTAVGYAGGHFENPKYEDVCYRNTGHSEVVEIEFNPNLISYDDLLNIFWSSHDPTHKMQAQYKSVIFYFSADQMEKAQISKDKLQTSGQFPRKIETEILPATKFYRAEEYHQQYYEKQKIKVIMAGR